ncbi:flagellar biosynthetic protein FliR [Demequina litorisediminis]|uniref:Flagellar biosynthetic protein FliR n=1 Tax=Demequina litorisediminis TaxID=1849022 RepID=A0ABQ6IFY4_9MICO|nr:hypothetical protein GCM10025876_18430 [Demequina litorisediminis]
MSGSQGSVFSKFYYMAALALLFASDAYQVVIGGVVRSFEVVPLGMGLDLDGLASLMTSGLTGLMVSALQIAGPLLVVLFLADVGLGLLTRVAPALNAFALGFPLKILITLVLGSVAFLALPQVIAALTDRAFGAMTGVGCERVVERDQVREGHSEAHEAGCGATVRCSARRTSPRGWWWAPPRSPCRWW